jgi:hypothetical protein
MTTARWLLAAALAGCSANDDPNDAVRGRAGEADLVHYCDTLCRRDVECFDGVDPAECDLSCAESSAGVEDRLNQEYVAMLDACIAEMDCDVLVTQSTEPCVNEVDATLPPTMAGKSFCEALDATRDECGQIFAKATCLQISKQFNEFALGEAQACTRQACTEIYRCISAAFGVTEDIDPNSCIFAGDGVCDEPEYCVPGTDSADCGR